MTGSTYSRSRRRFLAGLLLLAVGMPLGAAAQLTPADQTGAHKRRTPEYRIGPGDDISITFPFNAELNHDGPVGPDGRFTMPLVGSLALAGDTVEEATLTIATALRQEGIVADAHPSLTIRKYGAAIFVGGEVKLPSVVPLTSGMDALQAVIAAGGLLDTAKTRKVAIIRRSEDGRALISYVDLHTYVRGHGDMRLTQLEPRDVVFVPKTSVAEADTWIDQYLNKLLPFGKSLNYNLGNYATTAVTGK